MRTYVNASETPDFRGDYNFLPLPKLIPIILHYLMVSVSLFLCQNCFFITEVLYQYSPENVKPLLFKTSSTLEFPPYSSYKSPLAHALIFNSAYFQISLTVS
jgi:hypothetical protein